MVNEFETLDTLNEINDALDSGDLTTVKDKLMVLKTKYQNFCDEFDKWADEESKRQADIENGQYELDFDKTVTDCV